jgi:hypothetical protein
MRLKQRRILDAEPYLAGLPKGEAFKIIAYPPEGHSLKRAGFGDSRTLGETVLPSVVGSVSRFNAEGGWQVHRDRPKERRYMSTWLAQWTEWAGRGRTRQVEELRDVYRSCYPRTFIEPPGLELTYLNRAGAPLVALSATFLNDPGSRGQIRHAINLMLELFGSCELVRDDLSSYAPPGVKRINWRMLPPGAHPWPTLRNHLDQTLRGTSPLTRQMILERQEFLVSLNPAETYVGLGGFADYIAYTFPDRGVVVLESVKHGNALYAFGDNWRRVSQLTKAQVLNGNVHLARIIHANGWKRRLVSFLTPRHAAE